MQRWPNEKRAWRVIAVVDYGAGNTQSVVNALEHVLSHGIEINLTADPATVLAADGVIVPGVGAVQHTIGNLRRAGLIDTVLEVIRRDTPFLGICMGMQALMTFSEENGGQHCLNVVPGRVRRIVTTEPVPHMGWNSVRRTGAGVGHPLFNGIPDESYFYFVHSYVCVPDDQTWIIAETDYPTPFASVVGHRNLMGTQFHPEKSGALGLRLLANFTAIAHDGVVVSAAGQTRNFR